MITDQACFIPPKTSAPVKVPKNFRRLKCHEVVNRGDYVESERQGFETWEGPGGFRADTFVKPIYRRQVYQQTGAGKSA
jgi:hypothetical protein